MAIYFVTVSPKKKKKDFIINLRKSPFRKRFGSFLSYSSTIASKPCLAATRNADLRILDSLPFRWVDCSVFVWMSFSIGIGNSDCVNSLLLLISIWLLFKMESFPFEICVSFEMLLIFWCCVWSIDVTWIGALAEILVNWCGQLWLSCAWFLRR